MNDILNPNFKACVDAFNKHRKQYFKDEIKGSFLNTIYIKIINIIPLEFYPNLEPSLMMKQSLEGIYDSKEYDACRHIIGLHKAYTMFFNDVERSKYQKDTIYINKLVNEVIDFIHLREYGDILFRRKQLIKGEHYLYYPVPYLCFVITSRSIIKLEDVKDSQYFSVYGCILRNSISALSMMENNTFEEAYPICRILIEFYIRLLVLKKNDGLVDSFKEFSQYEIDFNYLNTLPDEFENRYNSRKYNQFTKKFDYLHYGWIDNIKDYNLYSNDNYYNINGLFNYLINIDQNNDLILLRNLYKKCHIFAHGNVAYIKDSLYSYFELSSILKIIISETYKIICEEFSEETYINHIDVLNKLDNYYLDMLDKQKIYNTNNH